MQSYFIFSFDFFNTVVFFFYYYFDIIRIFSILNILASPSNESVSGQPAGIFSFVSGNSSNTLYNLISDPEPESPR